VNKYYNYNGIDAEKSKELTEEYIYQIDMNY